MRRVCGKASRRNGSAARPAGSCFQASSRVAASAESNRRSTARTRRCSSSGSSDRGAAAVPRCARGSVKYHHCRLNQPTGRCRNTQRFSAWAGRTPETVPIPGRRFKSEARRRTSILHRRAVLGVLGRCQSASLCKLSKVASGRRRFPSGSNVRRAVGEGGQFLRCREIVDPVYEPAGRDAVASGGDSGKQEPARNGTLPTRTGGGHSSKRTGRDGRAVPYRSKRLDAGRSWRSLRSGGSVGSWQTRQPSQAARTPVALQRPLRLGAQVDGLDCAVLDVL
jgi:hypothetical protein